MIRQATQDDIEKINILRKQVNDLHIKGEPNIFKPGFSVEMQEYAKQFVGSDQKILLVCEDEKIIRGYAMVSFVIKPETPYRYELKFAEIEEIGVDQNCQNKGYGKQLMNSIINLAKQKGFFQIELNMFTFNQNADKFYEKMGFETYRKHLRLNLNKGE